MKMSLRNSKILREKFISDYCKIKGWNINKLSPSQLLEVVIQDGYMNPNIYNSYRR